MATFLLVWVNIFF